MSIISNRIISNRKGTGSRVSFKTKLFTIVAAVTLTGGAAVMPFATMADSTIDALQAQIAALQAQLAALSGQPTTTAPVGACNFTRALTVGVRGDDVTCLQKYLMSTGHYTYSGGATGYFGNITRSAAAAWQAANGVSPAVGYLGSISRAKYLSLIAMAPMPTPTPTPTPTTSGSPAPVPAGSGLSVMTSTDQIAEGTLAPMSAMRIPMLGVVFTAANDGDITVNSLLVQRVGQADDAVVDGVVLLDENKVQIGLSKTLNSLHQATLNEPFTVAKGTSKKMWIAFNRVSTTGNNGQIARFQLVSVNAGTATVSGTFPMIGPGVTINDTLTIGSLASPARGVLDPGSARSSLQVGSTAFYATGVRWTVGSAEPISLEQVRFYQAGSAGSGDLTNVKISIKGTDYPTTVSSDGKYYTALISPGLTFDKGANIDFAIKADIAGGSNRTIDFDLQRRTDIVAKGTTFNYYILPAAGTATNSTTQGEGFTTSEPYYDAYLHTISAGSLRVEKTNNIPSGNVPLDSSNTPIGSFGFDAKGENIQISSLKLTYALSSGTFDYITGVSIVDDTGATVAGPKDAVSGLTTTFSDTFSVKAGYRVYTVKAKLSSSFSDGATISVSVDPDGDITAKGEVTGLTITPSPTSAVSANTMTIRKAGLKVSVSDSPTAQNVVRGVTGYLFSNLQYDATASGEDLRITSQDTTIVVSGSADPDSLNSCQMFDGTTALNTGSNVLSPSGNTTGTNLKGTFTLDNNLIIPKGTVKLVQIKCNIDSNAAANETWSLGLTSATGNDTVVVGATTGVAVTEAITNGNGPTMTVRSGGSFTVALDPSSPAERYGIAGKTNVGSSVFQFTSQYEALKLTKFGFFLASSTASTSDVVKVTFWDGATSVGEAVFKSNDFYATTTLTSSFIIPKDGLKVLSTTVDLISKDSIGKAATVGGDSGHLITLNYTNAASSTQMIGQASGQTLWLSGVDAVPTSARGIRLVKSHPTLARLAVPTNTITNGDMDLYRFSVTAPADGDIGLFKFTFRIATGTTATSSSFRVFAYTDSGFSTQAYAANPINANDVDCIGSNSLETSATDLCNAGGAGTSLWDYQASTTHIQVFFDPQNGTAAIPGRESIQVPAGQTRYFKLLGNIASAATGDSFTVALVGDSAFFPTLTNGGSASTTNANGDITSAETGGSGIHGDSLSITDRIGGGNPLISGVRNNNSGGSFFVWSPNTTTTSATSTNDWLNGNLLTGLPSTEMAQQSFSK